MTGPLWNDWGRNSVVLRLSMLGDRRLLRLPMMGGRLLLLGPLLLGLLKTHRTQLNLIPGSQRLQMVPRHLALGLRDMRPCSHGLEPLLDIGLLAGGVDPWRC